MTATATATVTAVPDVRRPTRTRPVAAIPALTRRRLALTVRSPRALVVPLLTPVLFALVIAPALANTIARPAAQPPT